MHKHNIILLLIKYLTQEFTTILFCNLVNDIEIIYLIFLNKIKIFNDMRICKPQNERT